MVVEGEYYDGPCKLLELPHYVMRILFSYLDATALYHLSRTCNYLKEFILDPSFWRQIDARDDPNICDKIEYCTRRLHSRTTHLYLRGNLSYSDLPLNLFISMKPFDNLRVLALESFKLRGSKVTLRQFPPGLEELSLRRTYVKDSGYFFQHSVRNMPKLRVLILDECSWVTCSFLLSVSKYEHLEIISIVGCIRVHINMIPYLNVAKLGCKKLKIFDCRFTGIGGELLRTFYTKGNLQRLYFQSFKSAEVDYQVKIVNHWDSNRRKQPPGPGYTDMSITDMHLYEYLTTTATARNEVEKVVDSVLYKDPYPECTCGGEAARDGGIDTNMTVSDEDMVHIPSGRGDPKFVCGKHMKDIVNLPKNFKDFFLSQQLEFHPVSVESDSNSDEEEEDGGCCYFGMGTSLIVPSMHDRTPSVGEEMSLPGEGASARNQSFPRVYVFNSNRDRDASPGESRRDSNSPTTSRIHSERRNSLETFPASSSTKRRHENSDGESDQESGQSKKSKEVATSATTAFDGLSSEAQEALVNQLVESVDDVSARIEKIMEANGLTASDLQKRASRLSAEEPSTSRDRNGTHPSPSCSKTSDNQPSSSSLSENDRIDMPSCSRNDTSNDNSSSSGRQRPTSNNTRSSTEGGARIQISNNNNDNSNNLERLLQANFGSNNGVYARLELAAYLQVKDHNYWKVNWKIPLKRLSLRGYRKVSDFTLSYIQNLDIELIDLTYTSVTKTGIENFLVHNPNCRVIHPLYCICKPKNPLF